MSFKNKLRQGGASLLVAAAALTAPVMLTLAVAPAAVAAPKAAKVDPAFGKPLQEANKLAQAKDFKGALAKADEAAKFAKSPNDKLLLEQTRAFIYGQTNNYSGTISALEGMIATGLLSAADVQKYSRVIIQCYDSLGQTAKAVDATRAYITKYGHDKDLTIFVAAKALGAKDYKTAIEWANRAIDGERKAGRTAPEKWYQIALKGHFETKDMASYYAGIERLVAVYPKDEYWSQLIARAEREPKFSRATYELDIYRLKQAAGVSLSVKDKLGMAEAAFSRKLAAEALAILQPMADKGEIAGASDPQAARNKRLLEAAVKDSATDKAGIENLAKAAAAKPTGGALANVAEIYMTQGDHAKAIELFQAALAKGGMDPIGVNATKLHLGIAQFRAGQGDAARKTWAEISGEDGGTPLAKTWSLVTRKSS